jgi:hypothetical protein
MGREYNAPGSVSLLNVNESWVRWTLKGQEPWSILVRHAIKLHLLQRHQAPSPERFPHCRQSITRLPKYDLRTGVGFGRL